MAFTPINTTTARDDRGRYHISAAPQYVTKQGNLEHIDSSLLVLHDDITSEYRITFGTSWITMTPEERKGKLKEAFIGNRHFGHIMEGDLELHPFGPIIRYIISYSDNVVRVEKGWDFTEAEDVTMGLFTYDLERRFGEENVRIIPGDEYDILEVDLTGVEADDNGEINLDPEIVPSSDVLSTVCGGASSWADAIVGNGSMNIPSSDTSIAVALREFIVGPNINIYTCLRGHMHFIIPGDLVGVECATVLQSDCANHQNDLNVDGFGVDIYQSEDWTLIDDTTTAGHKLIYNIATDPPSPIGSLPLPVGSNYSGQTVQIDLGTIVPDASVSILLKTFYDSSEVIPEAILNNATAFSTESGIFGATDFLLLEPVSSIFGGTSVDTSTGV